MTLRNLVREMIDVETVEADGEEARRSRKKVKLGDRWWVWDNVKEKKNG